MTIVRSAKCEASVPKPAADIRRLLADLGFVEVAWIDVTAESIAWFQALTDRAATSPDPPPLGLHLVLGSDFAERVRSLARNLDEGRIAVIQAVFDRP